MRSVYQTAMSISERSGHDTQRLRLCVRGGNSEQSAEYSTKDKLITKDECLMSSRHDTKPHVSRSLFVHRQKRTSAKKKKMDKLFWLVMGYGVLNYCIGSLVGYFIGQRSKNR